MLEAALEYALAGLPVFPLHHAIGDGCSCGARACDSPAKHPRTRNGLEDASTDPETIAGWWRRWPAANIGIRTGAPSGLAVLDVDPRHGGIAALEQLERAHGRLPQGPLVLTGSGGQHRYFADPEGTLRNSSGKLGAGLDVRGEGGYVVAPPSVHANGNPYKWLRPFETAPPWPAALSNGASERTKAAPIGETIPAGERNATLASYAGSMRRRGASEAAILAALRVENAERCNPPLPDSEVEAIAASIARYAPQPIPEDAGPPEDEIDPSELEATPNEKAERRRTLDGWTFVQAASETAPAVWGEADAILWAQGEPLMLVGPDGVGKTSLGQQLTLARLTGGMLLGLPIARAAGKVLYIAADRPAQAARSMRRMVTAADEEVLRERLIVHRGPLPFEITKEPAWTLRGWVEEHDATDVVIDSLKDIAPELTKDEVGSAVNRAFQELVASAIELAVLHHQRKQQQNGKPPRSIQDVYGSRWLTAGMGSIALLWGEPGDPVVSFRHLKQPIEEVGPFDVLHDHVRGRTTVHDHTDLEQLLANAGRAGLTCKEAARLTTASDDPDRNAIEKARRRLESLVGRNKAERRDDPDGLARYFAKDTH